MTDAQVADERFLVLINDLLASGEIPELLADDEIENVINGVRGEVHSYVNIFFSLYLLIILLLYIYYTRYGASIMDVGR